jgi:hypothetical protein
MRRFCEAWAPTYDAVFYCCDRFDQHQDGDPYRAKVLDLQTAADRVVRSTCATVGQRVIDIPPNMTTSERVRWIAARVTKLGITNDLASVIQSPLLPGSVIVRTRAEQARAPGNAPVPERLQTLLHD